ncbi:TonB-dependent receptor [Maricaulis sp.]|uniref:TonB-dependent receptor domain-containing protein n=1 Tax=Maricaulis sp. TaxID=1486257 RepID=UPI00262CB122|nr:TonB-dependent receptor [Maricaulis sp.]
MKLGLKLTASAMTLALAAGGFAAPSFAQETETQETELIVVTGSRIARDSNLALPIPVQSLSEEQLENSGELNLADVVNDVPALVASSTVNANGAGSTGANSLNLRGMGGARTLTLVNGRRHVSGFEGSQAVDIGSIPTQLVERVEVLTGGASAIYGSDAVTGVVNFILRDDYEGNNVTVRTGISSEGDSEYLSVQGIFGRNFDSDRGNFVASFDYVDDSELLFGDRDWAADNGRSRSLPNPARRFQRGDITASSTPNFSAYYDFATTGLFHYGLRIPTAADFIADYTAEFGSAPTLTQTELDLIDRASTAPSRAILPQPNFLISSNLGVIAPADFWLGGGVGGGLAGSDTNGNGVDDCLESFVGWNSGFFGNGAFGLAGGCWVVDPGGDVRPFQDGLIGSTFNGFGGDSIQDNFDEDFLIPETDKITLNFNTTYDFTPSLRGFMEVKYSSSTSSFGGPLNTFYDLLYGAPDNPYLPAELADVTTRAGGLYITVDPTSLGPNIDQTVRETFRFVGGFSGEFENGWTWEASYNHGEFTRRFTDNNMVILDRFFAAIDAVTDPATGRTVCRSEVDTASTPPTTIFGIPDFDAGIYSFTPGSGACQPANIWGGPGAISQEAINFITTSQTDELTLEQSVFSAILTGDTADFFSLPAGPIDFVVGAEYRKEESQNTLNDYDLGILPAGSNFTPGTFVGDYSDNQSLGFNATSRFANSQGEFDVTDFFLEMSAPILSDQPFAQELRIDAAYRYADYSTIGGAETWNVAGLWTPYSDLSVRASVSQAIRAPNISELFAPESAAFFRPVDPCDVNEIPNAPDPALRAANCLADGLPATFTDPLSARFAGVSGGNPNLEEEVADTLTYGFVYQPSFLPGFSLTVDYWDVKIEDAIASVSAQDIVDNCYDSTSFPNAFCSNFTRNRDSSSAQFLGFNFLRQSPINFAAIEASGYDFAATYDFELWGNDFGIRAVGSKQEKLDFFTNPSDPNEVDPELEEIQRPEISGTVDLTWSRDNFRVGWQVQYMSDQLLAGAEIETYENILGDSAWAGESYTHNLYGSIDLKDNVRLFGGINNVEDEEPFATQEGWPVSPRGRMFFLGVDMDF